MIILDTDAARFYCRVAGVCIHADHVLLHCWPPCDFWALPGGRTEVLETSRAALSREMQEEIGVSVEVGRLLWVVENFFAHEGRQLHGLEFYFQMHLPPECAFLDVHTEFTGVEEAGPLMYRWFPVAELERLPLFPSFLRTGLTDLPTDPVHLIHTDP